MSALAPLIRQTLSDGGVVVWVILSLSVLLYWRCFGLLIQLHQARRQIQREYADRPPRREHLHLLQDDLQDTFQRQRGAIAAMIAAAPLLGLLGTVTGMISTFSHLASRVGQTAMEGLAGGISEALIATMAGLAVAIPGVLLLYLAYRELQKGFQLLVHLEHRLLEGS